MASNFYQLLEANEAASQETLQTLFNQKSEQLKHEMEEGSPTAKEQLWFLRQAFETLSNPAKRAAYDERLKPKVSAELVMHQNVDKPEGLNWKWNFLLIAVMASALVGFGLNLGRADKIDDHTVKVLQTNRSADNDATRASTERVLVDGLVNNQSKIIDRSAEIENRSLNIQQDTENRRRQELEYRANAGAQILEMQRQNQEKQLAMQEQRMKMAQQQNEERRAANERAYWACMNSLLDRMSSADAGARCSGYR